MNTKKEILERLIRTIEFEIKWNVQPKIDEMLDGNLVISNMYSREDIGRIIGRKSGLEKCITFLRQEIKNIETEEKLDELNNLATNILSKLSDLK